MRFCAASLLFMFCQLPSAAIRMPCHRLNVPVGGLYAAALLFMWHDLPAAGIRTPCQCLNVSASRYSAAVLVLMINRLAAAIKHPLVPRCGVLDPWLCFAVQNSRGAAQKWKDMVVPHAGERGMHTVSYICCTSCLQLVQATACQCMNVRASGFLAATMLLMLYQLPATGNRYGLPVHECPCFWLFGCFHALYVVPAACSWEPLRLASA